MTDDIISTVAWQCGDRDCKAQWHKASYWCYGDGSYSIDNYSDGDHEDCETDDLPSPETERQSWLTYSHYVKATGLDPLAEFNIQRTVKTEEKWRLRIGASIVGPVLTEARRGGKRISLGDLPQHVREYLNLDARGRLTDFATWDDLVAVQPDIRRNRLWTCPITHDKPRSRAKVERELRALARSHLRAV